MSGPTVGEVIEELREAAVEAVGQIGTPGVWPEAARAESRAFEMAADFLESRYGKAVA